MSEAEAVAFDTQALELRYHTRTQPWHRSVPSHCFPPRRTEDADNNLRAGANRGQNLLRGGIRDQPRGAMRPIRGLAADVEINLGNW